MATNIIFFKEEPKRILTNTSHIKLLTQKFFFAILLAKIKITYLIQAPENLQIRNNVYYDVLPRVTGDWVQ